MIRDLFLLKGNKYINIDTTDVIYYIVLCYNYVVFALRFVTSAKVKHVYSDYA